MRTQRDREWTVTVTNDDFDSAPPTESGRDIGNGAAPARRASVNRALAVRFVVGFLMSVFVLLLGYRALVRAGGDRWYLDNVAQTTSWVLDKTGHSSRTDLAFEDGPRVEFVAVAGPHLLLNEARHRLKDAQRAGDEERAAAARIEIARLEEVVALPPEERGRDTKYFRFEIIPECGAMEIFAIYLAAVLAFPTTWLKRIIGVVAGLPLMYAVNIFRLACLAFIGAYTSGGQWFDFAHHFVWQGVYIIFVVAVWLGWIELVVRKKAS